MEVTGKFLVPSWTVVVNYEALGFFVTKTFLLDGNTGVQLAVTNPKQRMDKKERLNGWLQYL